jgi:hypothetical protein
MRDLGKGRTPAAETTLTKNLEFLEKKTTGVFYS